MRGAITLAALLAVPTVTKAGVRRSGRNDIIYFGFAVIIVTLVGQGMTLPPLVRRLHLAESPSVADAERQARVILTQAALDYLGAACDDGRLPEEVADGLRGQHPQSPAQARDLPRGRTGWRPTSSPPLMRSWRSGAHPYRSAAPAAAGAPW